MYICLSIYDNEQSDLLARVNKMTPLNSKDEFSLVHPIYTSIDPSNSRISDTF